MGTKIGHVVAADIGLWDHFLLRPEEEIFPGEFVRAVDDTTAATG